MVKDTNYFLKFGLGGKRECYFSFTRAVTRELDGHAKRGGEMFLQYLVVFGIQPFRAILLCVSLIIGCLLHLLGTLLDLPYR